MIHHTCFKCKRRFELEPAFVGFELSKLKKKNPSHYQAVCPACRAVNKVSVSAMQTELDSVAGEVQKMMAEYEEEKAKAKAEKKAEMEAKAEAEAKVDEADAEARVEAGAKKKAKGKEKAKAEGKA